MDRRLIEQKLEALRYCVERVQTKCPPEAETLAWDPDAQDIVALNLSRAVISPAPFSSAWISEPT